MSAGTRERLGAVAQYVLATLHGQAGRERPTRAQREATIALPGGVHALLTHLWSIVGYFVQ